MDRFVQETVRVPRCFDDVCGFLGEAASQLDDRLEGSTDAGGLLLRRHDDGSASRPFALRPDLGPRRLLELDGRLVLHSIIPRGSMAVTALSIVGRIAAPDGQPLRFEGVFFSRRMIERAAREVLESLASSIAEAIPEATPVVASVLRGPGIAREMQSPDRLDVSLILAS